MKKGLVLIILLFLANSVILLAQISTRVTTTAAINNAVKYPVANSLRDTTKNEKQNKKDAEKAAKAAAKKRQSDSIATVKALKLTIEKRQKDSIASAKTAKANAERRLKDSIAFAKKNPVIKSKPVAATTKPEAVAVVTPKPDVTRTAITDTTKILSQKIDTALSEKTKGKKNKKKVVDTLSDRYIAKVNAKKAKDAKALAKQKKREAWKNDVNRLSPEALAKMAFGKMDTDSSIQAPSVTRNPDVTFNKAREFALPEPRVPLNLKFYHRYWRDIELADAKNKQFSRYHAAIINTLLEGVKHKEITAYNPTGGIPQNPTGDAFTIPMRYDDIMANLTDTALVNVLDKDGNIIGTKSIPNPFTPEKISGYRIKEDVYYDKTRGRTITRIVGIAPLIKLTLSSGEVVNEQPLFWLRYADIRKLLIRVGIDPARKLGETLDDVFVQRRFYGRIIEESNPVFTRIKDYKPTLPEQEAEANRMENKIVAFRKNGWAYTLSNKSTVNDSLQAAKAAIKAPATAPAVKAKPAPAKTKKSKKKAS
ncbi:gliding motility associated protein GldN [Mucilaginibacter gracilis]|uniref:Gliding motility associated protein GldN n=1 Tax=Mucilaginibacter gracilis TaxID=423350 RepID=A0A495J2X8_9SPHI|nr:hypothetical protein [Mucilaginibacter gracilis]RKR82704.1 gliding motility associated protein GldN [Mucilaginibacter gracilis]